MENYILAGAVHEAFVCVSKCVVYVRVFVCVFVAKFDRISVRLLMTSAG